MRWRRGVGGDQIEDRRGMGVGVAGGGFGIVGLILALLFGGDVLGGGGGSPNVGRPPGSPDPDAELAEFVGFVVDNVQTFWSQHLPPSGTTYEPTKLVLFEEAVASGCGTASSATGPFYCNLDQKVYLDLGFFRELRDRFGAPGDFAQAYVIAHEFGHHVQNISGNREIRERMQAQGGDENQLSITYELQADCLAGVWANSAYRENLLETGDLEEGLGAAEAVGDDRIQAEASGQVNPETWTHGSSQQRMDSFTRGYQEGTRQACRAFPGEA